MKKDKELSPELYRVAREKGTETPFIGKYWDSHEGGVYRCVICGNNLFSSDTKFDSGTGWPSFTNPVNLKNIDLKEDSSYGVRRIQGSRTTLPVRCLGCCRHLRRSGVDSTATKSLKRRTHCVS